MEFSTELLDSKPKKLGANIPAFLLKLWQIVEDASTDKIISWSQNGNAFRVHDQVEFAKQVLPKYYKHSNFSSFVRQVNMYGFRKVTDPKNGSMKMDREEWEFFHLHFKQGKQEELIQIKRKVQGHLKDDPKTFNHLLEDIERLKSQHEVVEQKFKLAESDNNMLWREVADLRDRHKNQQAIINKLIQFFVNLLVQNGNQKLPKKRRALDFTNMTTAAKIPKSQQLQPYNPHLAQNAIFPDIPESSTTYNNNLNYTVTTPGEVEDTRSIVAFDNSATTTVIEEGHTFGGPTQNITTRVNPTKRLNPPTKSIKIIPSAKKTRAKNRPSSLKIEPLETTPKVSVLPSSPHHHTNADGSLCDTVDLACLTAIDPQEITIGGRESTTATAGRGGLATPVIDMSSEPTYPCHPPNQLIKRQLSITNREEISDDVDKISDSLNALQEMIDSNQISVDLKSLTNVYTGGLPSQLSLVDMLRMNQHEDDEDELTTNEEETGTGQLLPYNPPLSPSQFIKDEYTHDSITQSNQDYLTYDQSNQDYVTSNQSSQDYLSRDQSNQDYLTNDQSNQSDIDLVFE